MRSRAHLQELDEWRAAVLAEIRGKRAAAAKLQALWPNWAVWYSPTSTAFFAMPAVPADPLTYLLSHVDVRHLAVDIERAHRYLLGRPWPTQNTRGGGAVPAILHHHRGDQPAQAEARPVPGQFTAHPLTPR
jgi:hypothetical protein